MFDFKNYKLFIAFVIGLLFVACSPDLGNYDYHDINEVTIKIKRDYTALFGKSLVIEPKITSTLNDNNENRYEYKWYAFHVFQSSINAGEREDMIPIATTKNLKLKTVVLPPRTYMGVYVVTDKETGVEWTKKFNLKVESTISSGWLILNDINGKARLDMISYYGDENHYIRDVLNYSQSPLNLKGKPINVLAYPYSFDYYGVYITTTGNGTVKVDPNTFDWKETYRLSYEMVSNVPNDFAADFIYPLGPRSALMYKNKNVYYYYNPIIMFGNPINVVDGERYDASPYIGISGEVSGTNILYDMTNKRFLKHGWQDPYSAIISSLGTLFDYHTGKDLIWMGQTYYNNREVFAILKDPKNDKLYLARIKAGSSAVTQRFYGQIPAAIAADMNNADHFAVSPDFGYIFYSLNGKVYEYDFSLKKSKLMLNKSGKDITVLKFQHSSPVPNKLVIGIYNPASSKGTFNIYTVPPVNGNLVLDKSYDGFGKIKSVTYKEK